MSSPTNNNHSSVRNGGDAASSADSSAVEVTRAAPAAGAATAARAAAAAHRQPQQLCHVNRCCLDPQRWGWTASGGPADVLTPHEVRVRVRAVCLFVVSPANTVAGFDICFSLVVGASSSQ